MAKQATLTTITSTNNNASTLNANFSALNTALTNTLSRDGSTPNTMSADLDMNSQDILNAASVNTSLLYIGGEIVNSIGNLANWGGEWTTATAYEAYDIVYHRTNNTIYRCLVDHTSGTFATDLTAEKWEVYIGQNAGIINQAAVAITGGTITGITDLAIADGGTGASTAGAARTNLGVAIGSDVQAYDLALDDISGITQNAGDILYTDGTNFTDLAIGTAGQVLTVNSGATAPEWADNTSTTESFIIAASDETTDLTTGTDKVTFRMPYAFTVTDVRCSVNTAPTGSTIIVDINESGTSILSTKLTIDATETTSETAATPAVISDSALADDAEISIDIDQIGSTVAGTGLKVVIIGTPA